MLVYEIQKVSASTVPEIVLKHRELPQYLFNAGFCRDGKVIGITQPRRVAGVTVAKRAEHQWTLGALVDETEEIIFIGLIYIGEALLDPFLSKYSVIIVNEAHERTIHTDVLLGLLKKVQKVRSQSPIEYQKVGTVKTNDGPLSGKENGAQSASFLKLCQGVKFLPLKLIIMSASLDPQSDYVDAVMITIFQVVPFVHIIYSFDCFASKALRISKGLGFVKELPV
ncbi:hypothetical protein Nepgr_033039 [Nepenthes gracilis]|uniref:RNA helicase n=1 Tax=Nepenthes gracilis TaxID=150966 RepID=A0AAD3TLA2_NEPGR|nr:hypothetical protein Nepgr_033039 [Nepenthes gracilis]